jgi:hypothetical protein
VWSATWMSSSHGCAARMLLLLLCRGAALYPRGITKFLSTYSRLSANLNA